MDSSPSPHRSACSTAAHHNHPQSVDLYRPLSFRNMQSATCSTSSTPLWLDAQANSVQVAFSLSTTSSEQNINNSIRCSRNHSRLSQGNASITECSDGYLASISTDDHRCALSVHRSPGHGSSLFDVCPSTATLTQQMAAVVIQVSYRRHRARVGAQRKERCQRLP